MAREDEGNMSEKQEKADALRPGDYRQEARLYRDGNAWCAVPSGFRNLAIDPAGFGNTQEEAVDNLVRQIGGRLTVDSFVVGGFCRVCKDWVPQEAVMDGCRDPACPCLNGSG